MLLWEIYFKFKMVLVAFFSSLPSSAATLGYFHSLTEHKLVSLFFFRSFGQKISLICHINSPCVLVWENRRWPLQASTAEMAIPTVCLLLLITTTHLLTDTFATMRRDYRQLWSYLHVFGQWETTQSLMAGSLSKCKLFIFNESVL